jgi:Fe-S-cluster containining protein
MTKPITFPVCAEHYKDTKDSCCNNANVPLTINCLQNIITLGYVLEDFSVAGEYSKEDIQGTEKWWMSSMFKRGNKFYKINVRRKPSGNCIFLKEGGGCVLGKNRPAVCKIYPFWVDKKGKIDYEEGEKEYCYLGTRGYSPPKAIKMMGETPKTIKSYFELMKRDCINNKEKHREILLNLLKRNYIHKAV